MPDGPPAEATPAEATPADGTPADGTPAGGTPGGDPAAGTTEPAGGADLAHRALARAREDARSRGARRDPGRGRRARGPLDDRAGRTGTRAGPDPRDPQPLGAAVRALLSDRGWESTAQAARVVGDWEALVGRDLAAHCRPRSLVDGELVLEAESTAWATQLRLLSRPLLETLRRALGPGVVVRLRVQGPTAPSWRHGPRRVVGRGPRDTYG